MWVTKLFISPLKKGFFNQKSPNLARKWHFVHFGLGLAGSFGWWLWRASCISQDTYLLYNIVLLVERQNVFPKTAEIVVVDEYNITADNNAWYNKVGDNSDDLITDEHL